MLGAFFSMCCCREMMWDVECSVKDMGRVMYILGVYRLKECCGCHVESNTSPTMLIVLKIIVHNEDHCLFVCYRDSGWVRDNSAETNHCRSL